MSRSLLSGFRLRIADSNFNSPDAAYRIVFTDSSTTDPKVVYAGPDVGDASLGSIVNLDSQGYVPVSGIWLDTGRYNAEVQVLVASDPEDWDEVYTLRKIQGGTDTTTTDDTTIRFVDTIAGIRAIPLDELGGMVFNSGYYALNDGGQGKYRWNSTSLSPDDGGSSLLPTGQSSIVPGRWERVFDGNIYNIRMWGAIPGVADVSANIEKADLYCSRTSDDTGNTLVFPAGKYAIGAATLVFDAIGLTNGGIEKPVHYVIEENASFSGTLGSSVTFSGPTTVETSQLIFPFLTLNNVIGGFVRPEWWGAIGDGITDDSTAFKYCWNGSNFQAIDLKGTYFLDLDEVYNGNTTKGPKVRFRTGSSIIIGDSFDVQIGNIDVESAYYAVITGNLQYLQLTGSFYKSSWFGLDTVAKLSALTTAAQAHAAYELYWDNNFTFDNTFVDSSDTLHTFDADHLWFINDHSVTVNNAELTDRSLFRFANPANIGTVSLANYPDYKLSWFIDPTSVTVSDINHFIRISINKEKSMNFQGRNLDIPTPLVANINSGQSVVFKDLICTNSDSLTESLISVTGPGDGGKVRFSCCDLSLRTSSTGGCIVAFMVGNMYVDNCKVNNGNISSVNVESYVENCLLYNSKLFLTTGPSGYHKVFGNTFYNSEAYYQANDLGYLQNLDVVNNTFRSTLYSSTDNETTAFQHLVPYGMASKADNVHFNGNVYSNLSSVKDSANVSNIIDDSDGIATVWDDDYIHTLVIKDEVEQCINQGASTKGLPGQQYRYVNMNFTHGWTTRKMYNILSAGSTGALSETVNFLGFDLKGTTKCQVQVMAGNITGAQTDSNNGFPLMYSFTPLRVFTGNSKGEVKVDYGCPYGTPWAATPSYITVQGYISQSWEGPLG